jgi:acid phosphatase
MTRGRLIVVCLLAVAGCGGRSAPATRPAAPLATPTAAPHENLNAVLWMQTALEYEASAVQAYRLATLQLDAALKDPAWTAAIEQTADSSELPPAVILDIDETVLDNSYYQARQVRDNTPFASSTWDRWCEEARATAIPGALEFTQGAANLGVTVFYVTNRTANLEAATRRNLAALNFPLKAGIDTVLTRGERPEWEASPKGARRAHVARTYRVVLLIGDDLGDFIGDSSGTPEQRKERTAPQSDWWGERWIMLPNPAYGSWERAIVGTAADPIAAKRAALRYEPPPIPDR